MSERLHNTLLGVILIIRLSAALYFSLSTPLWERYDEINHYQYARFLAHEKRLPQADDFPDVPADLNIYVQYNQPPLYYLFLTPFIFLFDTQSQMDVYANPFPACQLEPRRHFFIHTTHERFPGSGMARAVWIARLFTITLGLGAVAIVNRTARLLFPAKSTVLFATAFFAFLPASVEITTWINNDAPLLFLGALTSYWLVRYWQNPPRRGNLTRLLISAILCAAVKLNGIAVFPAIALAIFLRSTHNHAYERRIQVAAFAVLSMVFIGGFFLVNWGQCQQPVCRIHRDTFVFDSPQRLWQSLHGEIYITAYQHFFRTAAAPYISDLYLPPTWMLVTAGSIFAAGSFAFFLHRKPSRPERALWLWIFLIVLSAIALAHLRVWWLQVGYMPVRYAAVALPAFALILAAGYERLATLFQHQWTMVFLAPLGGLLLLTFSIPPINYHPHFRLPVIHDSPPTDVQSLDSYTFASGIRVRGYTFRPLDKGTWQINLFMERTTPILEPLFVMVTAYNAGETVIEQCGLTAGSAMYPTLVWRSGEIVEQGFPFKNGGQIYHIDIQFYYLENRYTIDNAYDPQRPDRRLSGDKIILFE